MPVRKAQPGWRCGYVDYTFANQCRLLKLSKKIHHRLLGAYSHREYFMVMEKYKAKQSPVRTALFRQRKSFPLLWGYHHLKVHPLLNKPHCILCKSEVHHTAYILCCGFYMVAPTGLCYFLFLPVTIKYSLREWGVASTEPLSAKTYQGLIQAGGKILSPDDLFNNSGHKKGLLSYTQRLYNNQKIIIFVMLN